jgi:hypothetical protein
MKTEEKTMTLITRKRAASCSDSELQSLLAKLFNELASGRLDPQARQACEASLGTVRSELTRRSPK